MWNRSAVVALAGFLLVSCSKSNEATLAPPVAGASSDGPLGWGAASQVPGTQVMRVDLVQERSGLSSYEHTEIRNVLFLDPAEKSGQWLLPDHRHYFAEQRELTSDPAATSPETKRTLGTVALVKDVAKNSAASTGRLLLFDPVGRRLEWLADDVRRLNVASVSATAEFVILYERNRQFVTAVVDARTFKKTREQVYEIPAVK